jgi:uncharacterized protein YodC (DUF2158 family)
MAEFKLGDVVRLNSGGPPMTVEDSAGSSSEEGKIRCEWFLRDKLHHEDFHKDCITLLGTSEYFEERLERLRKQSNEFNALQSSGSKDLSQD